ncbi:hypothetical protein F4825DRAFT_472117 [Nemania diffusa]|nr:hypothetical protein F4825DRAFT_472117 [Nemania diffusa]
MDRPPFSEDDELCTGLVIIKLGQTNVIQRSNKPAVQPPGPARQKDHLPGEPNIQLDNATISAHLDEELATADLNRLSAHLWLVAKQDSSHISSLTHQIVRGREIVITERPGLHLVWHYNRVFIKPLPKYLLSHAFWDFYLISPSSPVPEALRNDLRKAALGFLRSYSYLVRRRSYFDLVMNEDHHFVRLMRSLEAVDDSMIKIILFPFTYHKAEAAMPLIDDSDRSWLAFVSASQGFSIFTLFIVAIVLLFLLVVFVALSSRETIFALKDLYRRRRHPQTVAVEAGAVCSNIIKT